MVTLEERGGYSWMIKGNDADLKKNPQEIDGQIIPVNSVFYIQDTEKIAYLDEDRVWKRKGVPV